MTGFMHEKELSRKTFLKGGGALVVGLSAAGSAAAANGLTPFGARGPGDYPQDQAQVDTLITLTKDNTVIVTHGETELGHGTPTGILMIVAEEMDMDMSQMIFAPPETWLNAVGGGSGSGGISSRSTGIRAAGAYAKKALLNMASTQLGVPVSALSVTAGVVSGGGKTVKYADLLGGKRFNITMAQPTATPGQTGDAGVKAVKDYKVVGGSPQRIDIPAKVMGTYTYVHNVRVPGMLHARIVRPRGAGANTAQNHFPLSVDAKSISHIPNAQVIQVNNFLAVIAPKEYDAIQAQAQLKVVWKSDPKLPGSGNFWGWLRKAGDTNTTNPARYTTDSGNVTGALASAAKTVSATYSYQYNAHVPIGPQCAVADVRKDGATIFMSGQQINGVPATVQATLAAVGVNLPENTIRVIFREGSSSYGSGQLVETSECAALCSAKVGAPVRMQWMRWDQHGWDQFGPAALWDVKAGVDASGKIIAADWTTYGQASTAINTTRELLGTATWASVPGSGGPSPSETLYSNTTRRVLAKTQPLYGGAFRCSPLRAPNAPQSYFASEQLIDELAYAAKMDPIAFRRQNIDPSTTASQRWLAVLDASTIAAGWKPKVAASNLQSGDVVTGRGFGFGTFASTQVGMVADVQVNKKTGKIVVKHLYIAQNNGITNYLNGVANQMSGAAIQGLSRVMYEQLTFTKERITSIDWVSYPILRFADSPTVTLINAHPGVYTTVKPGDTTQNVRAGNTAAFNNGWALSGSGEPPTAAVGSAVANAVFDATGVRIRTAPMNPANVRAALKAAGVA